MKRFGSHAMAALTVTTLTSIAACSSDSAKEDPNLTVTISGEGASLTGFPFPAQSGNDVAFVDGWDLKFDRILITVDDIVLNDNPDTNPTDQSLSGGVVARAKGPWAVDMSKPGAVTDIKPRPESWTRSLTTLENDLLAEGKDPHAQPLARFVGLDGNKSFDPSRRYAFGFDIVPAAPNAKHTNLDAAAEADYSDMLAKGISVLYVGTATFKGTDCKSSDDKYDYSTLPKSVRFRLGFKTPTTYKNCQNTDLKGKAFAGEEAQRGVQVTERKGSDTFAQITVHVDHPFWSTVDHDAAELYFDQMAAAASPDGVLVVDDLAKLDFTGFKDRAGRDLPWRSCIEDKPVKKGVRKFDSGSVALNPQAAPESALRNYEDYVAYQQSTQGHLNADGLCAVERHFAAPR